MGTAGAPSPDGDSPPPPGPRPRRPALRRDAAENRARMIDAARRAFAEQGPGAGMEDIARLAGVGPATLYRRFPTKDALVAELVEVFYDRLVALAEEATRQPPGEGLDLFLRTVGRLIAGSRGYLPGAWGELARPAQVGHLRGITDGLLAEARRAGVVNEQVTVTDIAMVVWGIRGVVETTGTAAPDAWQRHLDLVMAGLRTPYIAFSRPPLDTGQVDRMTSEPPEPHQG
ncbi:TetR/AcrR family transcriptional regulator [Streptomyces liangshanensis]|uniref:Helix-turn-helix transcriptional regulator n=1 Tax=Streptomyces liangshanensis TaxID=2717324 RepID=A0A6G9GSA9_9ACTN|nr:helix-turn-helix domain-containing protein [Streptomyces liangshanensis]QIQ01132.1 helix-turn-helix transcriptional regulator [Streptomyces liangshanensis]